MQVCKSNKAAARLFSVIFLLATGSMLFAQNQTTQIEMPQMPEMPSMPTVGGSFYTPSFPTRPNSVTSKNTTTETGKEKNESVLTEALTPESILTSNLSKGNVLTAYDISSLYDSGLFSNLSSLDTTSSLSTYNTNSSTNVLLQ